jgi:uncharacterized OB-fold protein
MSYLEPPGSDLPLARRTSTSQEFWDGCSRSELLFQRCTNCGKANFPPAVVCRSCVESALKWERSSGRGSLYSWTVVWRPQSDRFRVPYAPAIIDMTEGYQMLTNIVNCHVEDLHLNMPVEVLFTRLSLDAVIPYFQPASDDDGGNGAR